jgi:hypothetical protein
MIDEKAVYFDSMNVSKLKSSSQHELDEEGQIAPGRDNDGGRLSEGAAAGLCGPTNDDSFLPAHLHDC